ncbi:glycosyltransferase [Amycolatopsis thermophila]|uniref:Cellulose synthase/poly-beta-1,6-N-acetylglucosamine synthase-like glycosyltransferase/peptidoglycan/xylan/chitin deacetylase (PgdA/CDA1 family) n=1 Tax=Amycolatopsis thermophila TaxID=206084 RepID=A0ABU0F6Y3_9PSEU|nr:glycosyltransferase [Amycolatopsis thermophila]MDQ0383168.1 cellulose synthase/poly-beta-1,6-N-acetylglucosamine synthase-like glycosyltransferase/peptidoglycan/xylan/chitin deacetylase (PgdA/CDA1 family) [Amycolatopsis thermophila]
MVKSSRRRRIRWSWLLAGLLAALLAVMLVVAGFASAGIVSDNLAHDSVGQATVPTSVVEGGAVVDATGTPVRSYAIPDGTIALTFDDGPDPTWTPQVLSILRKHGVPGTFFVVGSRASSHPELIRAIHDQGSELAHHTFTHPDLVDTSRWRTERELDETQLALAGAAGVTSHLFRPPFSSSTSAIDDLGYRTVLEAGAKGYISVFTDADSDDWARPGVDAIVRNSTPPPGKGATVLMHDSGGDRSETVAALDRLIPQLQAKGYRFTTVSQAIGMPDANPPAASGQHLAGEALLLVVASSLAVVEFLQWILLGVGLLVIARLVLMVWVARGHARRHRRWRWGVPVTRPVTVIVPAHNERANIEVALRSIVASDHPVEVLVVDDGSTDGTGDLVESLGLPGVRVIRQANGGKPAALNTGIAHATHDLVVMVDGDTVFARDTVRLLVQPFCDPEVGAVAGNVKIANRDTFLTRLQHIEYVVGFNVDRRVHEITGSMTTVPGAAGAFRREAVVAAGGVSHETLAEDTDLTIAIGRAGWRVAYEERAIAYTEAPATARQLWQQRFRWTYGTMQALWKHRRAIVQRGAAGRVGRFGLLHVAAFQILMPLSAPLIDIFFVYGLFFLNPATTLVLWLTVMALQTGGAALAFRMDREPLGPLWLMPAQQLVYRQLMYVVLGQSIAAATAGVRVRWQRMRRTGALDAVTVPAPVRPVAAARPVPVTSRPPATTGPARREHWFDVLRVLALASLIGFHATGWVPLSLAFPSMGVAFAIAGSLTARSLRTAAPVDVIGHRIRRVLPPVWLFGLVAVPVMLLHGWTGLSWPRLVFWVFPVLDPPAPDWADDATSVLWFVRTFLWFVLLTPPALRAVRARPVVTTLAPLVLVAADALMGSHVGDSGEIGAAVVDAAVFGACWLLGIAHREGRLARLHPALVATLAVAAVAAGGLWIRSHPDPGAGFDPSASPLGEALISAGAVLVLLRIAPRLRWLDRARWVRVVLEVINARVLTIYLWHNALLGLAVVLSDRWDLPPGTQFGVWAGLLLVAVAAFGWVEDLAARRAPRLVPRVSPKTTVPAAVPVA